MHKPQKVYTFSFIVGNIVPESVKCIHSATKRSTDMVWVSLPHTGTQEPLGSKRVEGYILWFRVRVKEPTRANIYVYIYIDV